MNLTCYIVDDESHAINVLTEYIRKTPGLELLAASSRPLKALEEITAGCPALTFLDIGMPEINGLEFAGLVKPVTTVVFTTSHREYGPEAFEKEAADYLLKPISYERFLKCIQKLRTGLSAKAAVRENEPLSFFIKTGIRGKFIRVNAADIIFIGSALNYIEIHLKDQKLMTYLSIAEVLEKLPADKFSRVHQSCIVNHEYIVSVEYAQLKLKDSTILPVGRAFRQAFRQKIKDQLLVSKWDHSE